MAFPRTQPASPNLVGRALALAGITVLVALVARAAGFTFHQTLSAAVFMMIISATLLFWKFRLAIAFIGIAALLGCRVLTLESLILSSELDIILFLVGMMTTVGVLKDLGLFTWIIQLVIGRQKMDGLVFTVVLILLSALMAGIVDEVTSIVFITALVFQVCDTLKIRPLPFVIISVMATNIGSSGTMLGNPIGILIGTKAHFTFQDFMVWAAPVTLITLGMALVLVMVWFRRDIALLSERLTTRRQMSLGLGPLVQVPYKRSLAVLVGTIGLIALHHQIEKLLEVATNTILIITPLAIAGVLMIWRHQRARHYIEKEVEWWTLLFFMMLFSVAGTLEHTGVTERIAAWFVHSLGSDSWILTPVVLFMTAIGSAFVDNVVFVAAFIPVVKQLNATHLWWALLFGACLGGNITAIGSTANIVALGMLEKRYQRQVRFREWLKVGLGVGLVTCLTAWAAIAFLSPWMPPR